MTSASSLAFPGGRTLATWWRQLAPFEPQGLSVGYLFVHRLDAPACWLQRHALDPLLLLVLEAMVLEEQAAPAELTSGRLQRRLHLDMPIVGRLVHSLGELQLIKRDSPLASFDSSWTVTEQGHEALRSKNVWSRQWQRGTFPFVERMDPTGHRLAPAHYLRILDAPASTWLIEEAAAFEVAWLHACLEQPLQWKTTFGFPVEVVAFPDPAPTTEAPISRDSVILDRTERLLAVFFQGPEPERELFGFGVRPEGWVLNAAEPIVRLPAAAQYFSSELDRSSATETWTRAWHTWCQMRSVPLTEARECALTLIGERLQIVAPEPLIHSLQVGKSDIFKGDTWILAGEGYVRQAARLELVQKKV